MSTPNLYRYRATICRRVLLEPVDDPDLFERITVHATDATDARRRIAAITGAPVIWDAERLSTETVECMRLVPSPSHLTGTAVFA